MKVLTFSRYYPKGHPKQPQPTYFVEKVWKQLGKAGVNIDDWVTRYVSEMKCDLGSWYDAISKHHTIRAGSRFKPGDMASLRVWSDKPYRSKQVEFAQVEVKKVWSIEISEFWWIGNKILEHDQVVELAKNDGLAYDDFVNWFNIHPKKKEQAFTGQIICWDGNIEY